MDSVRYITLMVISAWLLTGTVAVSDTKTEVNTYGLLSQEAFQYLYRERKDNVFTSVCHSFHRGTCTPPWADTLIRADILLEQIHPLGKRPLGRHPPGQTPPRQTPSPGKPPSPQDSHCSRWYASYWKAFW